MISRARARTRAPKNTAVHFGFVFALMLVCLLPVMLRHVEHNAVRVLESEYGAKGNTI